MRSDGIHYILMKEDPQQVKSSEVVKEFLEKIFKANLTSISK